ncbi:hypothetical protein FGG08_006870 [Glutinoglossum americanum]|uniref:Uncharacterized protein n=1 Tax=Glutinoglossum americanum TaxID=1670608 RepID=A0A9P8I003_9PEZI|nr:hypothetical protein FGG08_006870 [Glutinoglossum americanum]
MPSHIFLTFLQTPQTSDLTYLYLPTPSLLSLRLASTHFLKSLNSSNTVGQRLFGTLRVKEGGMSERMRKGLLGIGGFCGEVVVRVGSRELVSSGEGIHHPGGPPGGPPGGGKGGGKGGGIARLLSRSGSRKEPVGMTRKDIETGVPPTTSIAHWTRLFSSLPNLHTLTISSSSLHPTWTPNPHLDKTLTSLRCALETTSLPHLHTLRLQPIHPLGLLHLRHTIAFSDASWMSGKLWSQITTLVLHVLNPAAADNSHTSPHPNPQNSSTAGLTLDHQLMFAKILHSYIASFSDVLVRLVFVWVGDRGVCPLTLDARLGGGGFSAPALRMDGVRSLWLGNVVVGAGELEGLFGRRMRGVEEVWVDGEVSGGGGKVRGERAWAGGRRVWKFVRGSGGMRVG